MSSFLAIKLDIPIAFLAVGNPWTKSVSIRHYLITSNDVLQLDLFRMGAKKLILNTLRGDYDHKLSLHNKAIRIGQLVD
jgi:hypothetical protein